MTSIEDDLHGDHSVLIAFVTACPAPTPGQVSQGQAAHPEHAEDIAEFAEIMLENPDEDPPCDDEAEGDEMVARVLGAGMARLDAIRGGGRA